MFLKRCQYPDLNVSDLFIGNTVTVFSRQLKIVEYADVFTRRAFENQRGRTFGMIKPDAYNHIGKIIDAILQTGFRISNIKMVRMTPAQAQEFYGEHRGKPFYETLVQFITSDVVVGMELVGENAVQRWRDLIGPTNSITAKSTSPNSLRAQFGTDGSRNAVHGSDAVTSANRELNFFFNLPGSSAILNNCTCCVIRPHAMESAGQIIDRILDEGFEISALQNFHLDKPTAEEFFEVYKGVLPEFVPMVDHMTSGPCIALEIRQENAVQSFRELCGPLDPEVARHLRPNTIRAQYGLDRVRNGVHCTDLPEDGVLECEYFFRILQNK
jgi:nucleoside-diphosphate kinase